MRGLGSLYRVGRGQRLARRVAGHPARPLLFGLLLLNCAAPPPVDTSWHQESWGRWHAVAPTSTRGGFSQLDSTATGVTHANVVNDENALANRNLIIGAGVALGDVDGDGLADLFLASVERPAVLYRN